ncbi:MAG: ATP-binding protein [Leptospira bouyouniensis]|uniref:Arginosuccinate synthase n=1 Tax=Leptospira bouyouniensis TaxID=2484911 RepID=A0ABY2L357_9LEPT|nr:ATP-binding protein [Leptospira bouyouniensis]TGK46507.1 arginosuccinate synthase [Leptospira bouyouniensis]TGM79611.1 arginosuccinate synthase [Leptospira bouyouniensis]
MIPEIPASISNHFESMLKRMGNQLPKEWIKNKTKFLLSYSGGKDSSILLLFLKYLKDKYQIETPHLFYLSHGIRDIQNQEKELESYIQNFEFSFHIVKKKSQNYLLS